MNSREQSEYLLNRAWMWKKFLETENVIVQIADRGVVSKNDHRLVQAICCMMVSDMAFEKQVKTIAPEMN